MNLPKPRPTWNLIWISGLTVFLATPSLPLVQKYLGLKGIALYCVVVFTAVLLAQRHQYAILAFVDRYFLALALAMLLGLVAAFAVLYPLENAGRLGIGSDRDDALNIAVRAMFSRQYPYAQHTQLGNPITPLPGAILLAVPFVLLGNSAYQNFFWLAAFLLGSTLFLRSRSSALLLLLVVLSLSLAVQYEFISGGDLIANTIYVILGSYWVIRTFSNRDSVGWMKLISAALLGLSLASRINFILVLPLLFAFILRTAGLKWALIAILTNGLVAAAVIAPWYAAAPSSFPPFFAANRLQQLNQIAPTSSTIITILAGGFSLGMSGLLLRIKKSTLASFFLSCAAVQLFPILCAIALQSFASRSLNFSFIHDRYGLMFLFFGLWGCWQFLFPSSALTAVMQEDGKYPMKASIWSTMGVGRTPKWKNSSGGDSFDTVGGLGQNPSERNGKRRVYGLPRRSLLLLCLPCASKGYKK